MVQASGCGARCNRNVAALTVVGIHDVVGVEARPYVRSNSTPLRCPFSYRRHDKLFAHTSDGVPSQPSGSANHGFCHRKTLTLPSSNAAD
jgi:hypothetical protein